MSADAPVVVMIPGDLHLTEPGLSNHKTAIWASPEVVGSNPTSASHQVWLWKTEPGEIQTR